MQNLTWDDHIDPNIPPRAFDAVPLEIPQRRRLSGIVLSHTHSLPHIPYHLVRGYVRDVWRDLDFSGTWHWRRTGSGSERGTGMPALGRDANACHVVCWRPQGPPSPVQERSGGL
jgi:hypothetical protein